MSMIITHVTKLYNLSIMLARTTARKQTRWKHGITYK